jgi:L-2-hydroxyglutarate oxidase
VIATDEAERTRLQELGKRGHANGLQGLRWLEPSEFASREPNVRGVAAVYVPEEGIVDYARVVEVLAQLLSERGVQLVFNARARSLSRVKERWEVRTSSDQEYSADALFNCAGLHCDRVARQAGQRPALSIVPFRGEYHRLRAERQELVNHLVYPVPDPDYPFLGVHFTRLITGGVECGPNAVLALSREGYRMRDVQLEDVAEFVSFPGFWRFLSRHKRQAASELWASVSRRRFCKSLQKLVPEVTADDLIPGGSGVRAQALSSTGQLLSDFETLRHENAVHVLNAPSPAATASLAIARHLVSLAG